MPPGSSAPFLMLSQRPFTALFWLDCIDRTIAVVYRRLLRRKSRRRLPTIAAVFHTAVSLWLLCRNCAAVSLAALSISRQSLPSIAAVYLRASALAEIRVAAMSSRALSNEGQEALLVLLKEVNPEALSTIVSKSSTALSMRPKRDSFNSSKRLAYVNTCMTK